METKMDRTVVRTSRIDHVPSDFDYWQSQSYERRLSTLERIRREYHMWRDDTQNTEFREFIALLNAHEVRYLVVQ